MKPQSLLVPFVLFFLLGLGLFSPSQCLADKQKEEPLQAPQDQKPVASDNSKLEKRKTDLYRFTPHLTANAITRKPYGLGFDRSPGSNINTSFILGSLQWAVLERLEIGTVPGYFFLEEHRFNISFKYNFWRGKEFFWSIGLFSAAFDLVVDNPDPSWEDPNVSITGLPIILNYFPDWCDFRFGLLVTSVSTQVLGIDSFTEVATLRTTVELGFDVSYMVNDRLDITLGLGSSRETGVTAYERVLFGFGPSVRWYRPGALLSSPTIGTNYTPETGSWQLLLSSSIY